MSAENSVAKKKQPDRFSELLPLIETGASRIDEVALARLISSHTGFTSRSPYGRLYSLFSSNLILAKKFYMSMRDSSHRLKEAGEFSR